MASTKERQYEHSLQVDRDSGRTQFGIMSNQAWHDDPKRLAFLMSRYKFVAKMFTGMGRVLEVGCADAFATRIVVQSAKRVLATDFDPVFIEDVAARMDPQWPFDCKVHDILSGPVDGAFDGAFALDVIEHILPEHEDAFVGNMAKSLTPHGTMIVGSPSLQSQSYASALSKEGHVNCKDGMDLKRLAEKYFHNVFLFGMNDEVLHTGFHPMAQYLFVLCTGPK